MVSPRAADADDGAVMLGRLVVVVIIVLAFAAPGAAQAASTPTPERAVAMLNDWRGLVGVAPVALDAANTEGCRLHAEYYRLGGGSGHSEDPSRPGYTEAGNQAAASSVLTYGDVGEDIGPYAWEEAPYHRTGLLAPDLAAAGFWAEHGIGCMGVFNRDWYRTIPTPTAYPYPYDGESGIATTFICNETPNPCESVPGNDGSRPTGFIPTIQFDGPWPAERLARAVSVSLSPAGGPPIAVTVEDGTSPRSAALDGGIAIIPHEPLVGDTTYTAMVSAVIVDVDGNEYPISRTWQFRTVRRPNNLEMHAGVNNRQRVVVTITSSAMPSAWAVDPSGHRIPFVLQRGRYERYHGEIRGRGPVGTWRVCAASGGSGSGMAARETCRSVRLRRRFSAHLRRTGTTVTVEAGAFTIGRRVTVRFAETRRACVRQYGGRLCGYRLTGRTTTKVVRPRPNVRIRVPRWLGRRGLNARVTVTIAGARVAGVRVPAYRRTDWIPRP